MKRNKSIWYFYLLTAALHLLICKHSKAQEFDPSTWYKFVSTSSNTPLLDTFKVQNFTDHPSLFNWEYETTGQTELFRPADEGITDAPDGGALKLYPGSRFKINLTSFEGHSNVIFQAIYSAWKVNPGENLIITADRNEDQINNLVYLTPPQKLYSRSFTERKAAGKEPVPSIIILKSPSTLQLDIATAEEASGGFYALDSVYAYGTIKKASLFSGTGQWNDLARWSHLPPYRHRIALINGHATINNTTQCDEIRLGNGSLNVAAGQRLEAKNINFCAENFAFHSSGEVKIQDRVTVHRDIPKKGVWYFISFPFDVYLYDVDLDIKLRDRSEKSGGNFYYVYTYNGEKRSREGQSNSNWEVVPVTIDRERPIFAKGKGYLIALDEMSKKEIIKFSSARGAVPTDFGKSTTLTIDPGVQSLTNNEDQGWVLCGNPLPSALPVSALSSPDLDGYVYIYDGKNYVPYPLDSDYLIPPCAAFFVKARRATEITIHSPKNIPANARTLYNPEPLHTVKAEPLAYGSTTSPASPPVTKKPTINLNVNSLFIEDLLMPGVVCIWDLSGRLCWTEAVNAGSSVIHLPPSLKRGMYIIQLETKKDKSQHKFSWNQLFSK